MLTMALPLFPILKPVFQGRETEFLIVGLKMADKKDGKKSINQNFGIIYPAFVYVHTCSLILF